MRKMRKGFEVMQIDYRMRRQAISLRRGSLADSIAEQLHRLFKGLKWAVDCYQFIGSSLAIANSLMCP